MLVHLCCYYHYQICKHINVSDLNIMRTMNLINANQHSNFYSLNYLLFIFSIWAPCKSRSPSNCRLYVAHASTSSVKSNLTFTLFIALIALDFRSSTLIFKLLQAIGLGNIKSPNEFEGWNDMANCDIPLLRPVEFH